MDETWAITDIDFDTYRAAKDFIDKGLRKELWARKGAKTPAAGLARKLLSDPENFATLVGDLATLGIIYKAGVKAAAVDVNGTRLIPVPLGRGAPRKPETSVLLYDVRAALEAATGAELGIWQNDGDMAEGLVVAVARVVAFSVRKPLTGHLRTVAGKARKIETIFADDFLDRPGS